MVKSNAAAVLDRVRDQIAQMHRTGSVVRHLAVVFVAGQDVVVAIAEQDWPPPR